MRTRVEDCRSGRSGQGSRSADDPVQAGYGCGDRCVALLVANGRIYDGVCIHLSYGLGFCAEAAAMANMIKDGETRIVAIAAVSADAVLSPCGRCREMMLQVSAENAETEVVVDEDSAIKLKQLQPRHWLAG